MSELAELATARKVFLSISNGDENAEESDPNSVTSKKVSLAPFYYKSSSDFEDTIIKEYKNSENSENSENKVELKKMTLEKDGQEFVGFLAPGNLGEFSLSEEEYKKQKQEVETADSGRGDNELLEKKNNVAVYEALVKLFGDANKKILLNSNLKGYDYIAPFFYLYSKEDDKYYGLLYPKQVIKIKYKIEIVTRNYTRYNYSFTPKFTLYEWKARFPLVEELKVLFNHNFLKYSGVGLLTLGEGETGKEINQEYRQTNNFDLPEPIKGDLEVKVDVYTGELTTKNLAFDAADYYLRPEVQSCVNMRRNQYYFSYYDWHGHHWRYVIEADIDYYDSNGVCHFGHDSDNDTNEAYNGGLWENNYPPWSNLRFSIEALDGMKKTFNKNMYVSCWTKVNESAATQYHEASYNEYIEWFYYNEVKNREEVIVGWIDPYTPKYEWQWVTHKQPRTFWLELVIDY